MLFFRFLHLGLVCRFGEVAVCRGRRLTYWLRACLVHNEGIEQDARREATPSARELACISRILENLPFHYTY